MKFSHLIAGIFLALAALANNADCAQDGSINWQTDLNAAKRQAAAENKLVLLHFWGSFCRPCVNLEKFVFTNPRVGAAISEHYVPVKIDVEAQASLAKQFGITTIPHDVVITPDGQIIAKQASSANSDGYLRMVELVAQKAARANPQTFSSAQQIAQSAPEANPVNTAYVPDGQTSVTPEPIRMIGNSTVTDGSTIKTVAGQTMTPFAKDDRKFASVDQPNQFLQELRPNPDAEVTAEQTDNSQFIASQQPPTEPKPSPQLGLSMQTLRPLAGDEPTKANETTAPPPAIPPTKVTMPSFSAPKPQTLAQADEQPQTSPLNNAILAPPLATPKLPEQVRPPVSQSNDTIKKVPLGFAGYCPVTWFATGQFVAGQSQWGCEHRGRLYFFASPQLRDQFRLTPDVLSPMLAGYDPVIYATRGTLVDGSLQHQTLIESQNVKSVYLFSSAANKAIFESDSNKYIDEVRNAIRVADSSQ